MSRTAHHVPLSRSGSGNVLDRPGPWRSITVIDLRYSDVCLKEAARSGRRPYPKPVRRRTVVYSWAWADPRDRFVAWFAGVEERRGRQRLRRSTESIRQAVNATSDGYSLAETAEDFDVPPLRHRRNAVWQA
ncbi:hypothetical protein ACIBCT_31575 [Streptosporangium sp. NPDC050855]|uniref:hypothetical protein n=1 Tax=Streptosporangium sp. NPDC050855 TaxID=3366194 RepID=UPI0037A54DC5